MSIQITTIQKSPSRKSSLLVVGVGALSVLSTFAVTAQDIDYAKVVRVNPVIESVRISEPVEKCWVESQPVHNSYSNNGYNSSTPNIVGAIIGGVIGNQFGSGRGKGLATIAGAVLGGSVANDVKHKNRYNRSVSSSRNVERCGVTQQQHREERIVAYDVSYRYNGGVYHTQMDHPPGDEIKVAVNVVPVR
ncbi:MAG: glycine zipper 2TM domain-containing protein [Arenicellaceae bacterium]|nr:glycine zipper 2TM domain-containing protein [Arenicellaceae bacterium]